MTPLEKVLASEPKHGNWKVVHDDRRSEYRINGNCFKCTTVSSENFKDNNKYFRKQYQKNQKILDI